MSQLDRSKNNGSLQWKIQDLLRKKESYESTILKLKEEKCELQMKVDKLERELENTKQKMDFIENQRYKI